MAFDEDSDVSDQVPINSKLSGRHQWMLTTGVDLIERDGGDKFGAWLTRIKRLSLLAVNRPKVFKPKSQYHVPRMLNRLYDAEEVATYGGFHSRHLRILIPLQNYIDIIYNVSGRGISNGKRSYLQSIKIWIWRRHLKYALLFAVRSDCP